MNSIKTGQRGSHGYSLVEILAVVMILGIVTVPSSHGSQAAPARQIATRVS